MIFLRISQNLAKTNSGPLKFNCAHFIASTNNFKISFSCHETGLKPVLVFLLQDYVVGTVRGKCGFEKYSSDELLRAIGIICTNAVSQGILLGQGIYPTFSFISHKWVTFCHTMSHSVIFCYILLHSVTFCYNLLHSVTFCHILSHFVTFVTLCHKNISYVLFHFILMNGVRWQMMLTATLCHTASHSFTCSFLK